MPLTTSNEPGGAEGGAILSQEQAALLASLLEPLERADRAIGREPGPFRFETGTGYRDLTREDLSNAAQVYWTLKSAALASTARAGAGDWVTVPRTATKAMLDAAYAAHDAYEAAPEPKGWGGLGSVYKAMIEAARAVPASPISTGAGKPVWDDETRIAINTDAEQRIAHLEGTLPFYLSKHLTTICAHLIGIYDDTADPLVREYAVAIRSTAADLGDAIAARLSASPPAPAEHGVEIRELSEKATPGPWAYRPDRYDDWGSIRAPRDTADMPGQIVAVSRGECLDTHDAHRAAGTDPYEPNGRFIVALVNAYRSGELIHRSETGGQGAGREGEGRVAERVASAMEDGGWWHSCTGCHETVDGHETGHYPYSEVYRCHVGAGCSECGGIGVVWFPFTDADVAALEAEFAADPARSVGDESAATGAAGQAPLERVRHVKRGTEYEVLGEAEAQIATDGLGLPSDHRILAEGIALTVYRCLKTGKLWLRFTDEFRDGRFVPAGIDSPECAEWCGRPECEDYGCPGVKLDHYDPPRVLGGNNPKDGNFPPLTTSVGKSDSDNIGTRAEQAHTDREG